MKYTLLTQLTRYAEIPMTYAAKMQIKTNFSEAEIRDELLRLNGNRITLIMQVLNPQFRKDTLKPPLIQPFKCEGQDCYRLSNENE
jgi:hypothetical protein